MSRAGSEWGEWRRARASACLAVLVSAGWSGCSRPTEPLAPELRGAGVGSDVLLVTLDTTRADHLGCYGHEVAETPALDDLARRGIRFENAATVAPLTAPAHASILTGLYPPSHGVRANGPYRLDEEHETLAEVLSGAGYETAAFVSSFVLDRRFGFAQGFETYDDRVSPKVRLGMESIMERDAKQVTDAFLAWFESRATDRPYFAWVHYFDPHIAYAAPPDFAARFPGRPYDAEIAFMDSELGRVVARLTEGGRIDRTLIVVAADHGEALGQHGESTHGYFVYDEVVRVPLILSAPGLFPRPGVIENASVSLVDLVPTIRDLLGLPAARRADGRSLLSATAQDRPPVYLESLDPYLAHGWAPLIALRDDRWKYIRAPRPELYDRLADPGETVNLHDAADHAAARDRLAARLESVTADWPAPEEAAGRAVPLDPETRDRLQALGYSGAASAPRAGVPLADPKDMLKAYDRFQRASFDAESGRIAEALPVLRELVRESPGNRAAWSELAAAYASMGRTAESEAALRAALSIHVDPDSLMLLAQILVSEGRLADVDPLVEQALAIDPSFGTAIVVRGDLAVMQGRFDAAEELYRRAAEVDPYRSVPLVRSREAWLRKQREQAVDGPR